MTEWSLDGVNWMSVEGMEVSLCAHLTANPICTGIYLRDRDGNKVSAMREWKLDAKPLSS